MNKILTTVALTAGALLLAAVPATAAEGPGDADRDAVSAALSGALRDVILPEAGAPVGGTVGNATDFVTGVLDKIEDVTEVGTEG
ncbi:hypothetical protein ACWDYJ_13105 [Streptomyces sp. NPDC003042]